MKYSESETTESNNEINFSETETTEINNNSDSEGTGIFRSSHYLFMLLITLLISNNVFSDEIHIFNSNTNQIKGIYLTDEASYYISGELNDNVLNANVFELDDYKSSEDGTGDAAEDSSEDGTGKSTDEGTGDVEGSSEDGTGKSTDEGTGDVEGSSEDGTGKEQHSDFSNYIISVIIQCGKYNGIIEDTKSKDYEIVEGKLTINNLQNKCLR